ncbi:MAG: zinc ribbon domain-containing protein [Gaiellaceae bacterium]
MPIYGYRCPQNHLFEVFQRMADEPVETCQVCGQGPVERVLYPVAVHFKGSGFYTTDYGRSANRAKDAASESGSDKPKESVKKEPKKEPKKAAEA